MDDIQKIRGLLLQNQKIIRFSSESLTWRDSWDPKVIRKFNQDQKTVQDYELSLKGFRSSFAEFENNQNRSLIEINENGIRLSVKRTDIMGELNTELRIDGSKIDCRTKKFLVDTENFKLNEHSLTFSGEVHGRDCQIGGFTIRGNDMTGNADSVISSGLINTKILHLKNTIAKTIECNPENLPQKEIRFDSSKTMDQDEKTDTGTTVTGLQVKGDIWALYGWHDREHGTPYNFAYTYLKCRSVRLWMQDHRYKTRNRLRCSEVYSENAGKSWSDRRRKRNIKEIDSEKAEKFFLSLRQRRYRVKKSGKVQEGYIAQELQEARDRAGLSGLMGECGGFLSLRYPELTAFRINQIQRNEERIQRRRKEREGYHENKEKEYQGGL